MNPDLNQKTPNTNMPVHVLPVLDTMRVHSPSNITKVIFK